MDTTCLKGIVHLKMKIIILLTLMSHCYIDKYSYIPIFFPNYFKNNLTYILIRDVLRCLGISEKAAVFLIVLLWKLSDKMKGRNREKLDHL